MNYSEAIQFLYSLRLFGAKFGLENTFKLAALAGNPQDKLRFIHVAGTNGKGSTCAMLESVYRAAGLRVGLFTSPHLVSFRERIQVNRRLISEDDIVRLVTEVAAGILPAVEPGFQPGGKDIGTTKRVGNFNAAAGSSAGSGGRMPPSTSGKMPDATLFEFATVMALKYFAEQKCDLVIWETGLGGRLDATNIVTPLASVITNIALDHTQWLGDTLEKIAAEKAGIIKPGIPVVTATTEPEALAVVEKIAREKNAPLTRIQNSKFKIQNSETPLLGEHQKLNAALALATVEVLQKQIPVSKEQIQTGLRNVNWPGRLQLIEKPNGQKILLDGAHNLAGVKALRAALESFSPRPAKYGESQGEGNLVSQKTTSSPRPSPPLGEEREKRALILGVFQDKDWRHICEMLAPLAEKIFCVPVASERTANPNELAEICRQTNPRAQIVVGDSLADALQKTSTDHFIVVTGSLYLIGEALDLLGFSPTGADERGLNEWTSPKVSR